MEEVQIVGTSLCEWWACQGRQEHQGRQVGCTGQEGAIEPTESILHVLGRDILMGGTGKLSVVPRLHTSCLILHTQLRKCGIGLLVVACCVTVFPRRTQVEWQQEGERATCLPLAFSTKIYAPGHQSAVASSACPSWHPSPLSRCITDAGTPAPRCWVGWRNGEEGKGLHAPSGSELSAGVQVPNSPGIPLVFEEAPGSCRYTCAYSQGLSERG